MSSDPIISAKNLTKRYRLFRQPGDRIKQAITLGTIKFHKEFTALQDISFDIRAGEKLGIIGRNGAGKSTLLQTVCGILKPTSGLLETKGRISALLELGAGFNPEFTGRENVFFQGALMGINRQKMSSRFDEIAKFADIGDFMDQPVKIYSSGMFVRLAFAVAVSVDADIIVVDEALGVGDMEFQERSLTCMKEMVEKGVTVIFVSHSLAMVRNFCDRVIWLQAGRVRMDGNASEVCIAYQEHMDELVSQSGKMLPGTDTEENRIFHASGTMKAAAITRAVVGKDCVQVGDDIAITVHLKIADPSAVGEGYGLGILVHDSAGKLVAVFNTIRDNLIFTEVKSAITLHLPKIALVPNKYWISVSICEKNGLFAYDSYDHCASFRVSQEFNVNGIPRWEGEVACEHIWH